MPHVVNNVFEDSYPIYPQESLSFAIAKPFEINKIEKALKAAIMEDLVCIFFCCAELCFPNTHQPLFFVLNVPPYLC